MKNNKIIRLFKLRLNRIKDCLHFSYTGHLSDPILEDHVLLEAGQGLNINGNMFALLRELKTDPKWSNMKCIFVVTEGKREAAKERFEFYGFKDIVLTERLSKEYNQYLATCKYLITDNSFPPYFYKREEQVYMNTWHGTPLKTLGKSEKSTRRSFANIQKNYLASDYALFPNEFTKDVFFDDYYLRHLFANKVLQMNYPRNEVFYREDTLGIREKLGLEGKKLIAYMPTWRGNDRSAEVKKQVRIIEGHLKNIDRMLNDDQIFYVNLHFLVNNSIDYSQFNHIEQFPKEYETYDFLNICDVLVTDYSSVFFDFAVSGKKIILFAYDKEEYLGSRGIYMSFDDLPFPIVETAEDLIKECSNEKEIEDRSAFLGRYCDTGNSHISGDVLELMINGDPGNLKVYDNPDLWDDFELIFAGNITKMSTEAIPEYLENETPYKNHILVYRGTLNFRKIDFLNNLPENVLPFGIVRSMQLTFKESVSAFFGLLTKSITPSKKSLSGFYARERRRLYPTLSPSVVSDFSSRNALINGILNDFECPYDVCYVPSNLDYTAKQLFPLKFNKKDRMVIVSPVFFKSIEEFALKDVTITINDIPYKPVFIIGSKNKISSKHFAVWKITVPSADMLHMPKNNDVRVHFGFSNRYEEEVIRTAFYNRIFRRMSVAAHGPVFIDKENDISACFRQKAGNRLQLMVRDVKVSDGRGQQAKIFFANIAAKFLYGKNIILLFEKDSYKYEESASVLYEKLIDIGRKDVFFILSEDYPFLDDIADKYRNNIIKKGSFRHFLYFFRCKTFIGSEAIAHAIDTSMYSKTALKKIFSRDLSYVFLQHGVMYMVSLNSPSRTFFKRKELDGKYRVVVSSHLEADHFIEQGMHENEDLYICGLPKFDRSKWNENAEKIVIMPTWRPWEANEIQIDPTQSAYYKMMLRIVDGIPKEYHDRIQILPHPLFLERISKSNDPIKDKFMIDQKYDTILQNTALLITDYSSIAYDAYYRGAQVIFYWEEKDQCMEEYGEGTELMLNEENVFAPVAYNEEELTRAFNEVYLKPHAANYQDKFEKIVEFHDNKNTDRLVEMLTEDGLL